MSSSEIWLNVWLLIFLGLPIAYLVFKSNRGQTVLGWSPEKQVMIAEALIYLFIIYFLQRYVFPDSLFFVISAPVWLILFSLIIWLLLSGHDIFVLESTLQHEHLYNLGKIERLLAPETRQRLLVMDRRVYDQLTHIGDSHYPYWSGSHRIKFTDFFDEKRGVLYHAEIPELHNITFYIAQSVWLKMKADLPKLMRENVRLTWLSDYKLAHEQIVLQDNFRASLKTLKDQYTHEPFKVGYELEDLYNMLKKERQLAPLESEEKAPLGQEQAKTSEAKPETKEASNG